MLLRTSHTFHKPFDFLTGFVKNLLEEIRRSEEEERQWWCERAIGCRGGRRCTEGRICTIQVTSGSKRARARPAGLPYLRLPKCCVHTTPNNEEDYTESSSGTENEEEEGDFMRPSMTMSHNDDELSSPNHSRKINMEETKPTIPKAMAREEERLRVESDDEQKGTSTTSVKKKAGQDDNMVNNNNNNGNDVDDNDIDADDDKGEDEGEDAVQGDDEQEGRRRYDLRNCADLQKLSM